MGQWMETWMDGVMGTRVISDLSSRVEEWICSE